MSEMTERCCEAYWNAGLSSGYAKGKWHEQDEDQKHVVRHRMRAAIEAMREPTQDMMRAAQATNNEHTLAKWKAMIDTALT
jgi:hypothetical protein